MDLVHRARFAVGGALSVAGLVIALAAGCGGGGSEPQNERTGPSQEYRVARAIRTFAVGVSDGDGEAACRVLTAQRRAEITARLKQRSCEKAIAAQSLGTPESDLRRLARSRVTKVDLDGATGHAEIASPGERAAPPEEHIVDVVKEDGAWRIASQFFPGRLAGGKVPKAPPGPRATLRRSV